MAAIHNKHLPDEIIEEILVRLPIKSILKFKSTCKYWYFQIRSNSFIEFHRRFKQLHAVDDHRNQIFFSDDKPLTISRLSPSSPPPNSITELFNLHQIWVKLCLFRHRAKIQNSHVLGPLSNGIYCIILEGFQELKHGGYESFSDAAFCNPATRDFKLVSHIPCVLNADGCAVHYGFGTIRKTGANDYKMIVIKEIQKFTLIVNVVAYVYSLRRGSWKPINNQFRFPTISQDSRLSQQAYLNSNCHWIGWTSSPNDGYCVLRFDIVNEVFDLIAGPPPKNDVEQFMPYRSGVFVFNDRLAAFLFTKNDNSHHVRIDIWVMLEYGFDESWTNIYSCMLGKEGYKLERFLGMSFSSSTMDTYGFSTIERMYFVLEDECTLVSCNRSGFQKHCKFDPSWVCWKTLGLSDYIETLDRVDLEPEDMDEDHTT